MTPWNQRNQTSVSLVSKQKSIKPEKDGSEEKSKKTRFPSVFPQRRPSRIDASSRKWMVNLMNVYISGSQTFWLKGPPLPNTIIWRLLILVISALIDNTDSFQCWYIKLINHKYFCYSRNTIYTNSVHLENYKWT